MSSVFLSRGVFSVLERMGALSLPDDVVVGAFLELMSHYNRDSERVLQWQMTGQNFLNGCDKSD